MQLLVAGSRSAVAAIGKGQQCLDGRTMLWGSQSVACRYGDLCILGEPPLTCACASSSSADGASSVRSSSSTGSFLNRFLNIPTGLDTRRRLLELDNAVSSTERLRDIDGGLVKVGEGGESVRSTTLLRRLLALVAGILSGAPEVSLRRSSISMSLP
jgi:hypothetical protein